MNAPAAFNPHASSEAATTLVLLLIDGHLSAWRLLAGTARPQLIRGESRLPIRDRHGVGAAWHDLASLLQEAENLRITHLHWLADAAGRKVLLESDAASSWGAGGCHWQILSWEWLTGRFGWMPDAPDAFGTLLEDTLLPWLTSADDAAERARMQQSRAREHASESERLASERAALEQENAQLRQQHAALQQVDAERLVTYLPALFINVFSVLGSHEIALLCGRIEPLNLPNPYPELTEEALRVQQRRFRSLPRPVQQQIVQFVSSVPHRQRLQERPEMRELIADLEER